MTRHLVTEALGELSPVRVNGAAGGRRAAARPVPADVPARAGLVRGQEGLRRRRLRRLHRARRRGAGAQLRLPGRPGARPGGHHDRGPGRGARRGRSPGPGRVPRRAGVPVRLLHPRHDHDRGGAVRGAEMRTSPRAQGQHLPLHRLRLDRGRHRRYRAGHPERVRLFARRPGPSAPRGAGRRDRHRPVHLRPRSRPRATRQPAAGLPR